MIGTFFFILSFLILGLFFGVCRRRSCFPDGTGNQQLFKF